MEFSEPNDFSPHWIERVISRIRGWFNLSAPPDESTEEEGHEYGEMPGWYYRF